MTDNLATKNRFGVKAIWWTDPDWEYRDVAVNNSWAIQTVAWPWGNWIDSDLTSTVWGTPKVSLDLSLFHWLWTYNIPQAYWRISENLVDLVDTDLSTKCVSTNWQMTINSWTNIWDETHVHSRRHPRYQPNRWHYYATAWYMPNPTATWIREWGLRSNWNAILFRLEDWVLKWVMENSVWTDKEVVLDLPAWADLSAWNLFDIEYQWRWVGNYYFYFNLKLVWTIINLWTWTQVSTSNPAMAVHYRAENTDWTDVQMAFGCVDVTSEWGKKEWNSYAACTNEIGATQGRSISWYNQPLIIMRVKETLYWIQNTRDAILNRISASSDNKSMMSIWRTRDETAFWGTEYLDWNYTDAEMWSSIEYIDCVPYNSSEITFDTTKASKVLWARVPQDWTTVIGNPSEDIEFFVEQWDYLVLCWARESGWGCNMFWNIELGEEI